MVLKVAFYARVSTANKDQEYQQQIEALNQQLEIWKLRGEPVEHYKTFVDESSAYDTEKAINRPGFGEMMEEARQHKFDWLVVWSQDRFSRLGTFETYEYLNKLVKEYKIRYRTIQMNLDTNIEREFHMLLGFIQEAAKDYSRTHSNSVKRGIVSKRKNKDGTWKKPWGVAILQQKLIDNGTYQKIYDLRKEGKTYSQIHKEVYYYDHNNNKQFVSAGLINGVMKQYALQTLQKSPEENNLVNQELDKGLLDEHLKPMEIQQTNSNEQLKVK